MIDYNPSRTQNLEAEYALLGTAMTATHSLPEIAGLQVDYFSTPETRAIFAAIKSVLVKGGIPDPVVVTDLCKEEHFDASACILQAISKSVAEAICPQYIAILESCRNNREMLKVGAAINRAVMDGTMDYSVLVSKTIKALTDANSVSVSTSTSTTDVCTNILSRAGEKDNTRITFGIPDFDAMTRGVSGGQLIYLAARPGCGKTSLAIHITQHVAKSVRAEGGCVAYFSYEMEYSDIVNRILANLSGVDSKLIEDYSAWTPEMTDQLAVKMSDLITLYDIRFNNKARTPQAVYREVMAIQKETPVKLIVIDHMHLMDPDERIRDSYDMITNISKNLKSIALDLHIPVLALCQLNRESDKEERAPKAFDARGSGAIEQDADIFAGLWSPHPTEKQVIERQPVAIHSEICEGQGTTLLQMDVSKNRRGNVGKIDMSWDKKCNRFLCFDDRAM